MDTKQAIVMRDKFPDGKGGNRRVRRGKEIAQGCHGSGAFIGHEIRQAERAGRVEFKKNKVIVKELELTYAEYEWFMASFAKVVTKAEDEQQLLDIYQKALALGLEAHLITDSGRTEFGEPTRTCVGIGPDDVKKVDEVTKDLALL